MRFVAPGKEGRKFAGTFEGDGLTRTNLITAGRIDRTAFLLGAQPTDRIKPLERESQRIDHAMTAHAGCGTGLECHAFAGGELRVELGRWG